MRIPLLRFLRSTFACSLSWHFIRFRKPMRKNSPLWTRSVVLVALGHCLFFSGCDYFPRNENDQVSRPLPRRVYALGRLEPANGLIEISAIPGERLKALDPDVTENQRAPANGILGLLTSYDVGRTSLLALEKKKSLAEKKRLHEVEVLKAQKAQAEAALAQAEAKLDEVNLQEGKLDPLANARDIAAEEHELLESLRQTDPELATLHQLKKKQNELAMAEQEYLIARNSYGSTRAAALKAVAAAEANITVAEMSLNQLEEKYEIQAIEQEIEVAEENLKRSILLAPNAMVESLDVKNIRLVEEHEDPQKNPPGPYTVLKIFLRPGEFITQTPIIQMGDLSEMVCIAEVYEADVKEIELGQQVTLRSQAFAGNFADGDIDPQTGQRSGGMKGRVTRIGSLIAPPGIQNRNPLAPADRSVVEVRIAITDEEAIKHAANRVGLQVTVEFSERNAEASAETETQDQPASKNSAET